MKPGKPLKRKTRLVAKTPLQAKKQLKSGGFLKRGAFVPKTAMKAKRPAMTPEERACRKAVRARSESVCEIHGSHPAQDMHHRLNRSQGGLWTPANILHICRDAHRLIGERPQAAAGQGWSIRNQRNPEDVPCWLAGRGYAFLHDNGHVTEAPEEEEVA
jgi:hypothetical protein